MKVIRFLCALVLVSSIMIGISSCVYEYPHNTKIKSVKVVDVNNDTLEFVGGTVHNDGSGKGLFNITELTFVP